MYVFGPETHMTAIVGMALGQTKIPCADTNDSNDIASQIFFNGFRCTY